jgi:hypothetical protein
MSEKKKGPSFATMFMRLIALICGLVGVVLLINVFVVFDAVELIAGIILLPLSVYLFRRNRVRYTMTQKDKGMVQGSMMGHMMNMGDDE